MAGGHIGRALRRLRGLLGAHCAEGPTDGDLLRRYVHARDEAAFEALLRRHGPMVLGVCRRLLACGHDVDDAFQATFLILVRKAPSIGDGERVGNWLYGVAYRVAVRARAQAARLRARQRALIDLPCEEPPRDAILEEVRVLLDEEVSRLPARYREAVVCCYLQGRTQEEAARVLGWPKGTVATRLNRARQLLRTRLIRRGLPLSAGTLVGALRAGTADGALPAPLLSAALRIAGQGLTRSALPPAVAGLAEGVLRQVFLARVKAVSAALLALALATGGGGLAWRSAKPSAAPEAEAVRADAQPAQYYAWQEKFASAAGPVASARLADQLPCNEVESYARATQVTAIVLTADYKLLAAVSEDGTICVWDPGTGQPRLCVKSGAGAVSSSAVPPGEQAQMEMTGKVDAFVLGDAATQGGAPGCPACKVVTITFLVDGKSGPITAVAGCPAGHESARGPGDGRLARSVVPPGARRMLIETRVWLPAARAFVPANRVVIQTVPSAPPAPVRQTPPAPPPRPSAQPAEVKKEKGIKRCFSAVALCPDVHRVI